MMVTFSKVYICSPLRAMTDVEMKINQKNARMYAQTASKMLSCRAIAPHAILPDLVDERDTAERAAALEFGLRMLKTCDAVLVCGSVMSEGMISEIKYAMECGIPVYRFNPEACLKPVYGLRVLERL